MKMEPPLPSPLPQRGEGTCVASLGDAPPHRREGISVVSLRDSLARAGERTSAFTLLELLTVMAIIGILAAIILPSINSFKPDPAAVASQQLLADIGRARHLAMSQRTTVYMVFLPTNFFGDPGYKAASWTATEVEKARRVLDKQLVGYTFVSLRGLGDQPGRPEPRYLSAWRTMPEGTFIAPVKFVPRNFGYDLYTNDLNNNSVLAFRILGFDRTNAVPFPSPETVGVSANRPFISLPYIAFDYLGRLTSQKDEYIPIVKGSVSFRRDPNTGSGLEAAPMVNELPPGNWTNTSYNVVAIDWLTGRAHILRQEVR